MKKNIVTFFDSENFEEFLQKPEYQTSYKELAEIITEKGANFFVSKNYGRKNIFLEGLFFENHQFVWHPKEIKADVIYKKGKGDFDENFGKNNHTNESPLKILNQAALEKISWDKFAVAENFPEFSPETKYLESLEKTPEVLAKINFEKIVLKPLDAFGGAGIFIGNKRLGVEFLRTAKFPYLVQAFVDTSGGIPGFFVGVHDLRIIGLNGKIIQAFMRTAPVGSLLSNVSEGGNTIEIPLDKIPKSAENIFCMVDQKFKNLTPRLYSVDLARGVGGVFKLLEITAQPALFSQKRGKGFVDFQEALANCLCNL